MTRALSRALRGAAILLAALVLVALAPERLAFAHAVGVSSGEYRVDGKVLYGDIGMAGRELARWLSAIDTNHDDAIDSDELAAGQDTVARALASGLTVQADGKVCPGSLDRAWVLEGEGGVVFQVHYTCPEVPAHLALAMPMLDALAAGHRHLARVFRAGKAQVKVLDRAHATWDLDEANASSSGAGTVGSLGWSMLKLGVEHILTGADHLVFLLGLILVGGSFRSLFGVVSAFTLAHSITLALAALSIFAPSPLFVEPAIALSIAYVGIENLFVKDASKRWRITFPFGLIHGFGFAGALREIALPRAQLPIALVSFNLGVELGQLAVLSLALPLVLSARRAPWFGERGVKFVSLAIAIGGGVLFIVRLIAR
ncbi:MAG TPA: HupE/UreJ family protein [Polyangiaceae bacterium]|nr:HupE/UreJ family protein [Polyangiaceae bacterium]